MTQTALNLGSDHPCSGVFSQCRRYRYELWRRWGEGAYVLFVMLNPSTADETTDDPTIRRCIGYAREWGYAALCVANLFAWRATRPCDMKTAPEPVGADNDATLRRLSTDAAMVIAAWGKDGRHLGRAQTVLAILPPVHCLHRNHDGSPAHPLYLPKNATPFPLS